MEIIEKDMAIDRKVTKETTQILIEGDIIVPDTKPDIDIVLESNASAYLDNKEISKNRINFKGNLDVNVLFIAKDEDKSIHSMQTKYPINDFINIEEIDNSMNVFASCKIANVDYRLINDRKVSFRVVLNIECEVLHKDNFKIVSAIEGLDESQMKKTKVNMNKIISAKTDRFNIKEEIEINTGRPSILEVLDFNVNIADKEIKLFTDKLNISGNLKAFILYKGDEEDAMPTYMEQDIPFNGSIDIDGASEDMIAEAILHIQDRNIQILENSDGEDRVLGLDIYIGCDIKISFEEDEEIIEDAYVLNKTIEIEKNIQKYPILICKNRNQVPIKEVVKLDEICPPILQILKVNGKSIIDNIEVLEDKILIEGIIDINVLYITNNDEYPMYCYKTILPFSQMIEARGAMPDNTDVSVDVSLEHISINMISDKDLETRCLLNFDTCVLQEKTLSFIFNINFTDLDKEILDKIPSMTIYVVQKGDTLWDLAKKFNTTVADIVEINDIENPDLIYPGEKLLIIKKVC